MCVCIPKGVMTRPLYIDDTAKMAPQKHEEQSQMQASKRVIAIQTPISFLNDWWKREPNRQNPREDMKKVWTKTSVCIWINMSPSVDMTMLVVIDQEFDQNIKAHKLGTRSKCVKNASRPPYVHVIGEMIIYTLITLASLFWSRWVFGAQSTLVSNHKPPIIERKSSTGFWFCVAVECATMSHLRFCAEEEVERSNKQVLLIIIT